MNRKLENAMNLYLEGIRDGHYVEAITKYTGNRYTQHSTGVKDGKEGFIKFFGSFIKRNPFRDIQIIRKLVDGKYVFLQAFQNINKGESKWVTTDFFETDNEDKIIEHWDVITEYCDETLSGYTSLDGPTQVKDFDKTEENKELVRNLLKDAFMLEGNPDNLERYISKEQYIQHDKKMANGIEAFAKLAKAPDRSLNYQEIVLTVGQGNYVATLSRATCAEGDSVQEICQVDLFRIEKGFVVEHWDNCEPVPEEQVNSGKF